MERIYRWYVKIRITLNDDPLTISRQLRTIYGDNAPSHLDIEKWIFNEHKNSLTNVPFEESSTDTSLKDTEISTGDSLETDDSSFLSFRSFTSSFSSFFSNLYDTVFPKE